MAKLNAALEYARVDPQLFWRLQKLKLVDKIRRQRGGEFRPTEQEKIDMRFEGGGIVGGEGCLLGEGVCWRRGLLGGGGGGGKQMVGCVGI